MPSASTLSLPFSPAELSYLHTSLSSVPPLRPDARAPTDFRPLNAETGILPATNGSAHLSFSDGSEAIVGIKLEVEKTRTKEESREDQDAMDVETQSETNSNEGESDWVSLTLTVPGVRDDDSELVFLEEMLREPFITATSITGSTQSLQQKLIINKRWHWNIYIDVLLISSHGLASYPLPLLSMATHLALRDTKIPKLKSEGEEDPIADDDWMASKSLYTDEGQDKPPITLLVAVVGDGTLFDPSREELKVADAIVAVSIGMMNGTMKMLAMRMVDTPARDTMKGVPRSGDISEGRDVPGVWKPRVGGVKRAILKNVVKTVFEGGVAAEVMSGLEGFLKLERDTDAAAA